MTCPKRGGRKVWRPTQRIGLSLFALAVLTSAGSKYQCRIENDPSPRDGRGTIADPSPFERRRDRLGDYARRDDWRRDRFWRDLPQAGAGNRLSSPCQREPYRRKPT